MLITRVGIALSSSAKTSKSGRDAEHPALIPGQEQTAISLSDGSIPLSRSIPSPRHPEVAAHMMRITETAQWLEARLAVQGKLSAYASYLARYFQNGSGGVALANRLARLDHGPIAITTTSAWTHTST